MGSGGFESAGPATVPQSQARFQPGVLVHGSGSHDRDENNSCLQERWLVRLSRRNTLRCLKRIGTVFDPPVNGRLPAPPPARYDGRLFSSK